jgi:hypothetical protein
VFIYKYTNDAFAAALATVRNPMLRELLDILRQTYAISKLVAV